MRKRSTTARGGGVEDRQRAIGIARRVQELERRVDRVLNRNNYRAPANRRLANHLRRERDACSPFSTARIWMQPIVAPNKLLVPWWSRARSGVAIVPIKEHIPRASQHPTNLPPAALCNFRGIPEFKDGHYRVDFAPRA